MSKKNENYIEQTGNKSIDLYVTCDILHITSITCIADISAKLCSF